VWTILVGLGSKLRVLALLFGVLKLGFWEMCSIVVIKLLNFVFPSDDFSVFIDAELWLLTYFFGLTK
jgi:hypothetical protein